jgi:hypothetical protein
MKITELRLKFNYAKANQPRLGQENRSQKPMDAIRPLRLSTNSSHFGKNSD